MHFYQGSNTNALNANSTATWGHLPFFWWIKSSHYILCTPALTRFSGDYSYQIFFLFIGHCWNIKYLLHPCWIFRNNFLQKKKQKQFRNDEELVLIVCLQVNSILIELSWIFQRNQECKQSVLWRLMKNRYRISTLRVGMIGDTGKPDRKVFNNSFQK